jgi:hypothetical protein
MNGMNRKLRGLALAALAAASLLSQAAPVVSVSPAAQTINIGDTTSVDIIVSGLTEPTGGFSLTLGFNSSFLTDVSFFNDPGTTMGAEPLDLSGGFSGGSLDLFFVADATETEASLAAAQGASFTLATVSFQGAANGLSPLKLSDVVLSNWNGDETLAEVGTRNGEICVGGNCNNVPEPASMVLVGAALGAMALLRRRRSGSQTA